MVLLFANQIMLRVPAQEIMDKSFGVARLEPSWTRYLRCQVIQVGTQVIEMHYSTNSRNYQFTEQGHVLQL